MSLDIYLSIDIDTGGDHKKNIPLFEANFTHNVTDMWEAAGVYDALYMSAGKQAGEIISMLVDGVKHMKNNQKSYEKMNPTNGWGSYKGALPWLEKLRDACIESPKAIIGVYK